MLCSVQAIWSFVIYCFRFALLTTTCLTSCFMLLKVCFADYSQFELIGYTRLWDCLYWPSFVFRSTHVKYCHRFDLLTINTRSCLMSCYTLLNACFVDNNQFNLLLYKVICLLFWLQPVGFLVIYCCRFALLSTTCLISFYVLF